MKRGARNPMVRGSDGNGQGVGATRTPPAHGPAPRPAFFAATWFRAGAVPGTDPHPTKTSHGRTRVPERARRVRAHRSEATDQGTELERAFFGKGARGKTNFGRFLPVCLLFWPVYAQRFVHKYLFFPVSLYVKTGQSIDNPNTRE